MDVKTKSGSLGELKVAYEFTKNGYHVFNQISGKAPFDLIVYKNKELKTVSVKSVSKTNKRGAYEVQLKSVRPNRSGNKIIPFDSDSCDIVAIFIIPEDKVIIYNSKDINVKSTISIRI